MKIYRDFDSDDAWGLGQAMKSKQFVKAIAHTDSTDIEVNIDTTKYFPEYTVKSDGQKLYTHSIDKVRIQYEIDPTLPIGEEQLFDPPLTNSHLRELIEHGTYLIKYVRDRDMTEEIDILNLHKSAPSIGGMFLFDLPDIQVLALRRIL